jgi:hypothetical protein
VNDGGHFSLAPRAVRGETTHAYRARKRAGSGVPPFMAKRLSAMA